jgi:general secretion pathway protein E
VIGLETEALPDNAELSPGKLPFSYAKAHRVILDPDDPQRVLHEGALPSDVLLELRRRVGPALELAPLAPAEFQLQMTRAYQRDNSETVQMAADISSDVDLSRLADEIPDAGDLMDAEDDAPIIRLINAILSEAVREKASDVHIETFEDKLSIRYRIDGVLVRGAGPKAYARTAAGIATQGDGAARYCRASHPAGWPHLGENCRPCGGHPHVDLPSAYGERVVLRLLDKQSGQLQLTQLAMPDSGMRVSCARCTVRTGSSW